MCDSNSEQAVIKVETGEFQINQRWALKTIVKNSMLLHANRNITCKPISSKKNHGCFGQIHQSLQLKDTECLHPIKNRQPSDFKNAKLRVLSLQFFQLHTDTNIAENLL